MSLWLHWREVVKTITMMRKEQRAKPNITTPRRRIRRREEDIRGNTEGALVAIYICAHRYWVTQSAKADR